MSESIFKLVVEKARARIALRANWTQHATARTRNTRACDPLDPAAVRFCSYGAMVRAAYEVCGNRREAVLIAERAARRLTGSPSEIEAVAEMHAINDGPASASRTQILDMYDRALAEA